MKGLKRIFKNLDINEFVKYFCFSILLIVTLISISTMKFTQSKYENDTEINIAPTLAFFVVDVQSQTGQIKLSEMVPRTQPYYYSFNVSNFIGTRRANVDLTYSIELVTTTNLPLEFKIYRGGTYVTDEIDSDTVTTDENGVYYRHLLINDVNVMNYNSNHTDVYTLEVEFPVQYQNSPDDYSGIIDLVDIKINAEQVV
ncbi:MAG: hypothetical protein IJK66_00330 [Bacilli bacterium]|nr:hypothetical protein [Bacilli bacterium]